MKTIVLCILSLGLSEFTIKDKSDRVILSALSAKDFQSREDKGIRYGFTTFPVNQGRPPSLVQHCLDKELKKSHELT